MTWERSIAKLTDQMQNAQTPFWRRVRAFLEEQNVDPSTAALAGAFPNEREIEFGLVVTKDRRVIQLQFDDPAKPEDEKEISDWEDLSEGYQRTPLRDQVGEALMLLEQASPEGAPTTRRTAGRPSSTSP